MFRKKSTPPVGRQRRTAQPTQQRGAVFSYHASRSARPANVGRDASEETEKPLKRQRRRRWWHKTSNMALLLLLLAFAIFSLRLSANPKVVLLGDDTSRIFLRDPDVYAKAAHQLFSSSTANSNKVTVNASDISKKLQAQFPELEAVSVSLPIIGHQPAIYIQPATPKLLLATQHGDTFVVDHSGRALIDAAESPRIGDLGIPTVIDQSGVPIKAGHVALDEQSVTFITEVAGQLQSKHIEIKAMTLSAGGSELDVQMAGVGYFAKFNIRGVAREEAGTFLATKQQLEREGKHPGQYIDVRVSGRAYYK